MAAKNHEDNYVLITIRVWLIERIRMVTKNKNKNKNNQALFCVRKFLGKHNTGGASKAVLIFLVLMIVFICYLPTKAGGGTINITGTTNVSSGTVDVAVNGTLQGQTGTISGGTWSIAELAKQTGNKPVQLFYTPISTIIIILVATVLISFFTGIYPSLRAARIDPLKSMRYE